MSKHTKGPWWLHREYSTIYVEGSARDARVVQEVAAVGPKEGGPVQQLADAFLIVSAPDMLGLLQEWDAIDGGVWHAERHASEKADLRRRTAQLIAKATHGEGLEETTP